MSSPAVKVMQLSKIAWCVFITMCAPSIRATPAYAENYPNFAQQPVVIEYDADPAWPKRPDHVAPFGWVSGMAIDDLDQVWIFNRGDDPVQVYTTNGDFIRTWGKGRFADPHHIRIGPDGNVWVADFGRHIVQKYTPEGDLLLTLGVPDEPGEDQTHLNMPTDMAVSPEGDVFVADGYGNRRIVHFDGEGRFIKAWGGYGTGPGQFVLPHAIVMDSKRRLYVADRNSGRIMIFDELGEQLDSWSNLIMPWGLSVAPDGGLWVCGSTPHWWVRDGVAPEYKDQVLMRFDSEGSVHQVWSLPVADVGPDKNNPDLMHQIPGQTAGVHCIAQDRMGNLYIGDIYSQRAQKLVPVSQRQPEDASSR